MKTYKVWLHIEELDDEVGEYRDLENHTQNIGPEFNTEEAAVALKELLLECTPPLGCECDNTHENNKTVCKACHAVGLTYETVWWR